MAQEEVYISCDVEADGPVPGIWSMLSLGAAAFILPNDQSTNETPFSTFTVNLERLAGSQMMHPGTAEFWRKHPKELAACREKQVAPLTAMSMFADWIRGLGWRPVAVAYPLGFDWTFINWYSWKFLGRNPLGLSGIDIKTLVWAVRSGSVPFHDTSKSTMPREWFGPERHTHMALEDAIEQGVMFQRIVRELRVREEQLEVTHGR